NDYGQNVGRLIESNIARREFHQECFWHSQNFAHFIQTHLGKRYGLAERVFPSVSPAFALHPYYRESRRLEGLITVFEQDILPRANGRVATKIDDAVAIGNYANDHHYPGVNFSLQPKSIRWGGRWTGTPFSIPYGCLIPKSTDGLLVCEKNISVSHIANGATRLQPVVMGVGQAAGMAAALCCELNCQPRDLPVKTLQMALLTDERSPTAVVPLFNLPVNHPDWLDTQIYYLENPEKYPLDGNCSGVAPVNCDYLNLKSFIGIFNRLNQQDYRFTITNPTDLSPTTWKLVTLGSFVDEQLQHLNQDQNIVVWGHLNSSGNWLLVEHLEQV
ncbi:MAG: FAD-dependent oxidoreductase, partial [Nostocales cyanobacterium]